MARLLKALTIILDHKSTFIMKFRIYIGLLLLVVTSFSLNSKAQESIKEHPIQVELTKQKRDHRNFYRTSLKIDSAKAEQVLQVQETYKSNLKAISADSSLNIDNRRAKIKQLIDAKNQNLQRLLTPAQLEKLIPTTEREPAKVKQ